MYAHIYDRLAHDNQVIVRKKFDKLVKDDTPMVRRGASQALAVLASKVEE